MQVRSRPVVTLTPTARGNLLWPCATSSSISGMLAISFNTSSFTVRGMSAAMIRLTTASRLARSEKEDILRDISSLPLVLEETAHRQTRSRAVMGRVPKSTNPWGNSSVGRPSLPILPNLL